MYWTFERFKSLILGLDEPLVDRLAPSAALSVSVADVAGTGSQASDIVQRTGDLFWLQNAAVSPMATLTGTNGNDTLKGTSADDIFKGRGGSDTYVIFADGGYDTFDDTGSASDFDRIIAKSDSQEIGLQSGFGPQSGIEEISANGFFQVYISGTDGQDVLDFSATTLTDILTIVGGLGRDIITGSSAGDNIRGNNHADHLYGGDGDDSLFGGGLNDLDPEENAQHGADGNDTLDGGNGNDQLAGGADNDLLLGGDGNDTLLAANGDDALVGGNGNDSLDGSDGNDQLNGGDGTDDLTGGAGADTLNGGGGRDTLSGNGDNDSLSGGGGNDLIRASEGFDTLTGGAGADTFQFAATGQNQNRVTDFNIGSDLLDFSRMDSNTDTLANDAFIFGGQGAAAEANSITFSINGGTTTVRVDVNGDTVADMTLFLTGAINLSAQDFLL